MNPDIEEHKQESKEHHNQNASTPDVTGEWCTQQLDDQAPPASNSNTEHIAAKPGTSPDATGEWGAEQLDDQAPAGTAKHTDTEFPTQDISVASASYTEGTGEWRESDLPEGGTVEFESGYSKDLPLEPETLDRPAKPEKQETPDRPVKLGEPETLDRPVEAKESQRNDSPRHETPRSGRPASKSAPRERVGRYAMNKFHAKGGMGEIWLAQDLDIGRAVAFKKMRPGCAKDGFLLEAQVTGQLEHPGIVPIHELGTDDEGQPFYVMKFIQGRTLSDVIKEYHSPDTAHGESREVQQVRLLQMFVSLCQTMAYAHSRAVLHRDLKPDNVMVGSYGETLVLDWGLAKVVGAPEETDASRPEGIRLSGDTMETQAGSIKGSPTYIAPESARGEVDQIDQKTDIFLLGGILYSILTGNPPRSTKKLSEMLKMAAKEAPPPPRTLNAKIPKPINAICAKALAFKKEDRYDSAQDLAEDVQRYLAGEPVSAYQESFFERAGRWCRRHRTAIVRTVAALTFVVLVVFSVTKYREMEAEAAQKLQEVELDRQKAAAEAALLQSQETARSELKKFRRLADEARYFAANSDPATENAPFFDPKQGVIKARAALAIVQPWGSDLDGLPVESERSPLRKEVYELLLLLAHLTSQQGADAPSGKEVLSLLKWANQLYPSTRGYHRLRGWALDIQGDKEAAAQEKERAENVNTPTTALDHFLLGEQFRIKATRLAKAPSPDQDWQPDKSFLARAIEEYRKSLDIDPENYWSHFQLGRCYLSLGKGAEAVETLGTCVALRPTSPWGYSARGLAFAFLKNYPAAKLDLDRAISLAPDFRPPQLNRGVVHTKMKNFEEALLDFDAVLQPPSEKKLIQAAYYRGHLYLEKKDFQKALADFNLVAQEETGIRQVHLLRAQILFFEGKDEEGFKALNAYLSSGEGFDPESAAAYEGRGRHLRLLAQEFQNPQRKHCILLALEQLQKAEQLGGKSVPLFDNLGAVKEGLGSYQEAVTYYSKAIDLEAKNARLSTKRGWAYEKLVPPNYMAAQADFTAALEIEPGHAEAHTGLGYVQACLGQAAEAQRQANLAVLHGSGDYLILHNVACIYAKLSEQDPKKTKNYQDLAIDQLQRAVELWKKGGTGPSELLLIKYDPAFPPSLRGRPEFQKLVSGG